MDISSDKQAKSYMKTWLRNENLKKRTEYFLIEAQNNAILTNYVQAKIDQTPQ